LGTLSNNATSVVICHNFIFLQWRLTGAIATRILQSHLYFYFLTFGRSEQVLGQSMSKENIKLRDDSGNSHQESGISSQTKSCLKSMGGWQALELQKNKLEHL
jgi:hypothetical protein